MKRLKVFEDIAKTHREHGECFEDIADTLGLEQIDLWSEYAEMTFQMGLARTRPEFSYSTSIEIEVTRDLTFKQTFEPELRKLLGFTGDLNYCMIHAMDGFDPWSYVVVAGFKENEEEYRNHNIAFVRVSDQVPPSTDVDDFAYFCAEYYEAEEEYYLDEAVLIIGPGAKRIHNSIRRLYEEIITSDKHIDPEELVGCATCKETICCRWFENLLITKKDAQRLARGFTINGKKATVENLVDNNVLVLEQNSESDTAFAFLGKDWGQNERGDCVFLVRAGDRNVCSVYDHRPDVCRAYLAPDGHGCDLHDDTYEGHNYQLYKLAPVPDHPRIGEMELKPRKKNSKALPMLNDQ